MTHPRLVTFSAGERRGYGLVSGSGLIDLSKRYASTWPTLREVIEAGALVRLADEAAGLPADISLDDIRYEIPVPAPEKIPDSGFTSR